MDRNVRTSPKLIKLLAHLSKTKGKIITALWPGEWVRSSRLLELTGQKYFDRRIRELKDESGFDIEAKVVSGAWSYRLKSHAVRFEERQRQYPNAQERRAVIKRDGIQCSICGYMPPNRELKGYLQFDHKIPFHERNGKTRLDNLQLLCTRCNVIKRRACQICPLPTCANCAYAYPEKFGGIYVIGISKQARVRYASLAKSKNIRIEDIIQAEIDRRIS